MKPQRSSFPIWLEKELITLIGGYFLGNSPKCKDFTRLFLRRDGLTFQDKIEIVKAMVPLFAVAAAPVDWNSLLRRVEEFKAFRNAFSHGFDASTGEGLNIVIEVVTRSGKEKQINVNPKTHRELMAEAEQLLADLRAARKAVNS